MSRPVNRPLNRPLRALAVFGALALSLPVACAQTESERAAEAFQSVPSTAPPAEPMVRGLPDFTGLVEQVGPAVVNISAEIAPRQAGVDPRVPDFFHRFFGPGFPGVPGMPEGRGGTSLGSGFIISDDGYILTNHHVVAGAEEVTVTLPDRREFDAEIVGSDEQYDVALLKIDGENLPALRTGSSHELKPGQWVVAIGSPFGLDHSVTAGIVSAVGRSNAGQQYVPFIQTDVAINRGNSGGPLLNTRGEVVGIYSQIFSNSGGYMGVSFAIPIDLAMNAARQIKATGEVSRGQLGVQVQSVTPELARALDLPSVSGALINVVVPGTAAEEAGLQSSDVIVEFDGKPVEDYSDLPPLVGSTAPGTEVEVVVIRNGGRETLDVVLDALEGPEFASGRPLPPGQSEAAPGSSGQLGLVVQNLSAEQRQRLDLEQGEGVLVAQVVGEPAREARMRPGDVILAVGRDTVGSVEALNDALSGLEAGETVMLLVRRGNATQYVGITAQSGE
jgi:serine protease Do